MPRPVGGSHRVGVVRLSGQRVRGGTLPRRWMMMVCRARDAPGPAGGVTSGFARVPKGRHLPRSFACRHKAGACRAAGTRWDGGRVRVIRILGTLEPGGAQLSTLRLSVALRRHGVATTLLAGDATPAGLELAARYGLAADACRVSEVLPPDTLQWTPASGFAGWLEPRIARARLVHAHMVGAWWAAARAVPPGVPLVASEHNQMSWPRGDHTPQARDAARRVDMFFAHGPAARAWAAGIGLDDGRLRDGRSSVEGQSAAPWPGLPWPRLTFAGRLRGDKAPDVLVEALALLHHPPAAFLVGDGPLRGALTRLIRARGLEAVVHLPGWFYEPAATSPGPACTSCPHGRSRGRRAPYWAWDSASRSSAPRSTAWRARWARAAAFSSGPRTRTPSPTRYQASWAASTPTPPRAEPTPGSSPPAPPPRSTPAPTASCSPAGPDPEGQAHRRLESSASSPLSRSSRAGALAETAAHRARHVTALKHAFRERSDRPGTYPQSSSATPAGRARIPGISQPPGDQTSTSSPTEGLCKPPDLSTRR
jgi:Glycosyltransferase Family 4